MRRYLADTIAQIVFSTIVGAFVEIVVAGLTPWQSAGVRLAAIPVILFIGRPYGIYRDWLFRLTGAHSSQLGAIGVDTVANVSFQIPVYRVLLAINGATASQVRIGRRQHRGHLRTLRPALWPVPAMVPETVSGSPRAEERTP
ncbi:L-alanine exporter AlaE [Mycolicibacterium aubagnense]